MGWLSENGLALYGAVTGTAALAISYFSYRHNIKKDTIRLTVTLSPHPNKSQNIENMRSTDDKKPWEQINLAEVFLVTVRNLGSVPAPLEDVGVITETGKKEHALVSKLHSSGSFLYKAGEAGIEALEAKGSRTFSVYLRREQSTFSAKSAYVIDKTGKTWKSRA
ncbi:hypothetical protein ACM9XB_18740 [Xanthomonas sacchari]